MLLFFHKLRVIDFVVVENRKLKEKQFVTIVLYDYDIGNNKVF